MIGGVEARPVATSSGSRTGSPARREAARRRRARPRPGSSAYSNSCRPRHWPSGVADRRAGARPAGWRSRRRAREIIPTQRSSVRHSSAPPSAGRASYSGRPFVSSASGPSATAPSVWCVGSGGSHQSVSRRGRDERAVDERELSLGAHVARLGRPGTRRAGGGLGALSIVVRNSTRRSRRAAPRATPADQLAAVVRRAVGSGSMRSSSSQTIGPSRSTRTEADSLPPGTAPSTGQKL